MSSGTTRLIDAVALSKNNCSVPVQCDLKYSYADNFIGRAISGYEDDVRDIALLAPQAAKMLCKVQNFLVENFQLSLLVFDAYRPLRATRDFVKWSGQPLTDAEKHRKLIHFPAFEKQELFKHGYIAEGISNHCYGQAVDVTLFDLTLDRELDLGTCFDFFGELSHSTQPEEIIGKDAFANRTRLITAMAKFNFVVHPNEYWHYDFHIRENLDPLDIPINEMQRGLGVVLATKVSKEGA